MNLNFELYRYPDNSYKTRTEEQQKGDQGSLTRWDWINDMSQQYGDENEISDESDNDEGSSGH